MDDDDFAIIAGIVFIIFAFVIPVTLMCYGKMLNNPFLTWGGFSFLFFVFAAFLFLEFKGFLGKY